MEQSEEQRSSLQSLVHEMLEVAGLAGCLTVALDTVHLPSVPAQADAFVHFLEGPLQQALESSLEEIEARMLLDDILDRAESLFGMSLPRMRPRVTSEHGAATVPPPPPLEGDNEAYSDLATGAIHTRPTPTWGIRRPGETATGASVWLFVSNGSDIVERARRIAPAGTDVLVVSSMAILKGALSRSDAPACSIVIDAQDPSIPVGRAIAGLTEEPAAARVILWRVDEQAREKLLEAVPMARTWLAFEPDVTAQEVVQLLALGV